MTASVPFKRPTRKSTPFHEFSKYENGKIRNLRFNVNALADFEEKTGMGFAMLMGQRAVFASARAMIWAGLKHEDARLTIEDVGELLSDYLGDESFTPEQHNINMILMVAIQASIEQGALGRRDQKAVDDLREQLMGSDPNALPSPETISGSSQTDNSGPSGSSEPKNTPTEN